ncbi:MAG: dihydrodipicolinate reductase C-terminal domain-containing protein [Paludibacteraceae bacterium]|nr:dihydrodipicolinate reductase C-terminal domain-containing protein [Paludibacteraceae bacterium]
MNIALIGYGKMGHFIEQVARRRGHEIVCIIDRDNTSDFRSPAFAQADVAIEFSTPATAEANIRAAWLAGIPVVCGTTGWNVQTLRDELCDEAECCQASRRALLWSSNFSVGVNIFFALNKRLAGLLADYPDYLPSITETHHIHKLDAPSGTAKTLAEDIERFRVQVSGTKLQVPIKSIREGEVPGIHTVTWDSPVDTISITHSAKSREGFALGAVLAAEWLKGKTGWHTMEEVLNF